MSNYQRSFPLEDIAIRSDGDGRTVEAYAAVFDSPTEIHDREGHYLEQISPKAFNKAIADASPTERRGWLTKVMFNHGRDMYGGAAAEYSMPIGTPLEIKADSRGLLTITRYAKTRVADDVLELIREGAITAQSFQGRFIRSDKPAPRRGWAPDKDGNLALVTREEVSLMEYGPTPFPAYQEAAVVGVRQQLLHALEDEELANELRKLLATRNESDEPTGTPTGAAETEPQTHSVSHFLNLRAEARKRGVI